MNTGRLLRVLSQALFLVVFVLLLGAAKWPLQGQADVNLFLRADPLAGLAVLLSLPHFAAGGQLLHLFIPALILLVLTAILGRFYCGWICPLGTCIDIFHAIFVRPFKKRDSRRANRPHLKYYVLAAVLLAALFGTQAAWVLDPSPLITRTFGTALHPALLRLQNWLVGHDTGPLAALGSRLNLAVTPERSFAFAWPVAAVFFIVLALGFVSRRHWCRTLCPLGALLGLAGRHGLWRRQVAEGCTACRRCVTDCKMGAIPAEAPRRTRTAECILCYNCVGCGGCVHTRIGLTRQSVGLEPQTDLSRRRLLAAAGAGLIYGLLAGSPLAATGRTRSAPSRFLIRPPGAIVRDASGRISRLMTESELRAQCLRCGECMKACPTGVIQPALLEVGLDGFYTPVMVAAVGCCERECNACGQVCPSGALRPFSPAEKPDIRIAEAAIDHTRCLSWQKGDEYTRCLQCEQVCPYGAVLGQDTDGSGQLRPVVRPEVCVGCGTCEFNCPVGPPLGSEAAIRIYRREDRDAT